MVFLEHGVQSRRRSVGRRRRRAVDRRSRRRTGVGPGGAERPRTVSERLEAGPGRAGRTSATTTACVRGFRPTSSSWRRRMKRKLVNLSLSSGRSLPTTVRSAAPSAGKTDDCGYRGSQLGYITSFLPSPPLRHRRDDFWTRVSKHYEGCSVLIVVVIMFFFFFLLPDFRSAKALSFVNRS